MTSAREKEDAIQKPNTRKKNQASKLKKATKKHPENRTKKTLSTTTIICMCIDVKSLLSCSFMSFTPRFE